MNDHGQATGPLDGIRVLDLSTTFMGPYATFQMARMGADVVKVESPDGDVVRNIGPSRSPDMGPIYLNLNAGKRSVVLDLKQPTSRSALDRLTSWSDVFVHNMRSEAATRLGVDAESVRSQNPRCIHCSFAGFDDGPYASLPAYDDVIQGASGVAAVQGRDGDPAYVVTTVADKVVGLAGTSAILAAVVQRERTGEGASIVVPMYEFMADFILMEQQGGWVFDPPIGPTGYARTSSAHRRPYRTADGFLSVMIYTDSQWARFFDLVGRDDLKSDPRFASIKTRTENIDALYEILSEVLENHPTQYWVDVLSAASIAAMPVSTLEDLFSDPHLTETGFFDDVDHPTEGRLRQARMPLRFDRGVPSMVPAPELGEHTRDVLREVGLSEDEVDRVMEERP